MQDTQEKDTNTDEVQSTREYNPGGGEIFLTRSGVPGVYPASHKMCRV